MKQNERRLYLNTQKHLDKTKVQHMNFKQSKHHKTNPNLEIAIHSFNLRLKNKGYDIECLASIQTQLHIRKHAQIEEEDGIIIVKVCGPLSHNHTTYLLKRTS